MFGLFCFVLAVLAAPFKSKSRLEAENAALRHQLIVLRRNVQGRVRLTNNDRWFFIQLYCWPLASQYMLWDATLPNFGVRVSPGGTKNFAAILGARRERVSIGRFPIISLAEARVKAKALMAERTLGQHQAKTIKFEEAYELFKSQHCARKKARTSHDYTRIIDVHFLAKLRHERLEEITYEALAKITDKLIDTPAEQAHAQGVARTFFRWAIRRRYLKHSPIEGMQIANLAARDRVLDDRELVAVYRAAQEIGYTAVHYPFSPR